MTLAAVLAMTGGTVGLAGLVIGVVLVRRARRYVARANEVLRSARRVYDEGLRRHPPPPSVTVRRDPRDWGTVPVGRP